MADAKERLLKLPGEWLVVGSSSMLGARFCEDLGENSVLHGASRRNVLGDEIKNFHEIDLTDPESVLKVVKNTPGEYVINFAAETDVDGIEKGRPADPNEKEALEQNTAYGVNVLGTRNLVRACEETGKRLIAISTGWVFDGKSGPNSEEDLVASNPDDVSWYAWTKVLAEKAIFESSLKNFLVIRLDFPYVKDSQVKVDTFAKYLKYYDDHKELDSFYPLFSDMMYAPTYGEDIPAAIAQAGDLQGVIHVASPKVDSYRDVLCGLLKIARGVEDPQSIIPAGSLVEFMKTHPGYAKRPIYGGLKVDKIISLGFRPKTWEEGFREYYFH